jgi:hypothetical protein
MTLNIDDDMIKSEATGAVAKVVSERIHELFKTSYSHKGTGYITVEKIIDKYITTQEFQDFVMTEIKQILAPTIKEVLQVMVTKKIKQYINEEKLNNPELFNEEKIK